MAVVEIMSYPLDNTGYVATDARLYTATRTSGVFSSDTHFVVTAVTNQAVTVEVSKGIIWANISEFEGLAIANKGVVTLKLNTAHNLLKRIDRIVVRFDKITGVVSLGVKTGTPASNPIAPALQRDVNAFELGIADISILPTTIRLSVSNISDTRSNPALCGIMADGVTRIPTETLYEQWYTWFSELRADWEEKARILQEWLDVFQSQFGDTATAWFKERDEIFNTWLSALGDQIVENVGSSIFGFAIEDVYLYLYYSEGIDPYSFSIENGYLMYNIGDSVIGGTLTSEINALKRRLDAIEKLDVLNLMAEILE